jgi:hypothetical protein
LIKISRSRLQHLRQQLPPGGAAPEDRARALATRLSQEMSLAILGREPDAEGAGVTIDALLHSVAEGGAEGNSEDHAAVARLAAMKRARGGGIFALAELVSTYFISQRPRNTRGAAPVYASRQTSILVSPQLSRPPQIWPTLPVKVTPWWQSPVAPSVPLNSPTKRSVEARIPAPQTGQPKGCTNW